MKPPFFDIRAVVVARPGSPGGDVVICARACARRKAVLAMRVEDVSQWPDAIDIACAEGALAAQAIVSWQFDRLSDAFAAAQWLRAGGVA